MSGDSSPFSLLRSMPPLDAAALAWFFLIWIGYNLAVDRLLRGTVLLNHHLQVARRGWMRAMLARDNRAPDAILMGHLINSVSFFASATMLLLAALIGILAGVGQTYEAVMGLAFIANTEKWLFEFKILLLTGVFIYAFFKFTWALRQYNYACALIGAAPPPDAPSARTEALAEHTAEVLSLAVTSFNGGLRAYYFALAALAWFVHPVLFMVLAGWMLLVLLRRQLRSRTLRAVRAHTGAMVDD
jgi:uncharacterized membrane protein